MFSSLTVTTKFRIWFSSSNVISLKHTTFRQITLVFSSKSPDILTDNLWPQPLVPPHHSLEHVVLDESEQRDANRASVLLRKLPLPAEVRTATQRKVRTYLSKVLPTCQTKLELKVFENATAPVVGSDDVEEILHAVLLAEVPPVVLDDGGQILDVTCKKFH